MPLDLCNYSAFGREGSYAKKWNDFLGTLMPTYFSSIFLAFENVFGIYFVF
jgi:hypothetical protein